MDTIIPFHPEEIESSIPGRFSRVVRQYPHRIAVTCGSQKLTYNDLDEASNQVAQAILRQRGEGEEAVALLLEDGIAPICALLGVLKAGKFFVALPPTFPLSKLIHILENFQAHCLITNDTNRALANQLAQSTRHVININRFGPQTSSEGVNLSVSPDSLATLFYTSGSTGRPKGVMKTHRNILHSAWRDTHEYHIRPGDRVSLCSSYSFARSMPDIWEPLLNGASLSIYDVLNAGVAPLAQWLDREKITLFHPPTNLFRQFLTTLTGAEQFSTLRLVRLGGQSIYKSDVENFRTYFPSHCLLSHSLASTETGRIAQSFIEQGTEITDNVVPVGYAVEDKNILVLDDSGRNAEIGDVGEIAVRSRYLSSGYWNDPELTRQKFLPDPEGGDKRVYLTGDLGRMRADGCLEYLGRKDFQVKIRGYRMVLTEIETALYHLGAVKDAVVAAREHTPDEADLIAYVVPAHHPAPTISELRRGLAEILPEYMLPTRFIFLETFPLTSTGKVDRQALPAPDQSRPDLDIPFVAPRNELEQQLQTRCEKILAMHPIGVEDNLFDLGMHSIQALRLLVELEKMSRQKLSSDLLSSAVTIAEIARILMPQESASARTMGTKAMTVSTHLRTRSPRRSSQRSRLQHLFLRNPGGWPLSYPVGIRVLLWVFGTRWAEKSYFQQPVHRFRRFLAEIGNAPNDPDIIRQYLLKNLMGRWISHALVRCPPRQFAHWVQVIGADILQHDEVGRQGMMVISSHFGPSGVSFVGFEHPDITEIVHVMGRTTKTVTGLPFSRNPSLRHVYLPIFDDGQKIASLHQTKQVLERGGLAHIIPDGYKGGSALVLPFLGRLRPFKTGFAELAVQTGARVIPVFASLDGRGRITVEFLNPLERGPDRMSRQEQIESLIQQYAQLLEPRWLLAPGNLAHSQIKHFLKLPPIAEKTHPKLKTSSSHSLS
ncbi:MAG: AMP-binding protein [bacterium]|nr:AMP-binding protein [bacterium]